ncbi:phosphoglycerate mutase [Biscogniauxia marginata]|nr:phosphoglycerate mutase [Biscogniauxia marginata]
MAPTIHLVRHAQGYHNLSQENQQLPDPNLTPEGEKQCDGLCKRFPSHDQITHLVASPLRRTLFTCLRSFAPAVQAGKKIVALPDAQEISVLPCDIGTDLEKLKAEFGDRVDLHLVQDGWNDKTIGSQYYPSLDNLEARARRARVWLRELVQEADEDAQVVLVTHGGILHFLTEDWDGIKLERGTGWANVELRSYEFEDKSGQDPNATLKETESSRRERQGREIPPTQSETAEIREAFKAAIAKEETERRAGKTA